MNDDLIYTVGLGGALSEAEAIDALATLRKIITEAVQDMGSEISHPVDLHYDSNHPDGPCVTLASHAKDWSDREEMLEWLVESLALEIVISAREREAEKRGGIDTTMIDVNQAAEELGVTPNRVRVLLREGRIDGAQQLGGVWVMPRWGLDAVRNRQAGRPKAD